MTNKEKSLLEIAVEIMQTKSEPISLVTLGKLTCEEKGLKTSQAVDIMPQFFCDIMCSGYFVYCGEKIEQDKNDSNKQYSVSLWDLKERQPFSLLEKDVADFEFSAEENREAMDNEMHTEVDDTSDIDEFTSDEQEDEVQAEIDKDKATRDSLEDDGMVELVSDIEGDEESEGVSSSQFEEEELSVDDELDADIKNEL